MVSTTIRIRPRSPVQTALRAAFRTTAHARRLATISVPSVLRERMLPIRAPPCALIAPLGEQGQKQPQKQKRSYALSAAPEKSQAAKAPRSAPCAAPGRLTMMSAQVNWHTTARKIVKNARLASLVRSYDSCVVFVQVGLTYSIKRRAKRARKVDMRQRR